MRLVAYFLLAILLSCQTEELSVQASKLKENALPIENLTKLSSAIYKEISKYDVIMMGELHGTKEPAAFVYGLSRLIADKEGKVTLALEIPSSQLEGLDDGMTKDQLKELAFFRGQNSDGRNGEACLDLIHRVIQDSRIELKFIDNYIGSTRDTSMYMELCEIKKASPYNKIVTLTGNIHNWLIPFNGEERIGGYLLKDSINFDPSRIMSVDHYFNEGTMLNSTGNGLELKTFEPRNNFYNQTISDKMYLCKTISEKQKQNTHFLFTETVTHSEAFVTE